jgi:hypothetical protein
MAATLAIRRAGLRRRRFDYRRRGRCCGRVRCRQSWHSRFGNLCRLGRRLRRVFSRLGGFGRFCLALLCGLVARSLGALAALLLGLQTCGSGFRRFRLLERLLFRLTLGRLGHAIGASAGHHIGRHHGSHFIAGRIMLPQEPRQ